MAVKFYWSENLGEAHIAPSDREHLLKSNWVYAADYLADIIFEASQLYDEVLEQKRSN